MPAEPSVLKFEAGRVICRQGERAESLFRLVSGCVRALVTPVGPVPSRESTLLRGGKVVAVLSEEGALFGEGGVVLERRPCSWVAGTKVSVSQIPISGANIVMAVLGRTDLGLELVRSLAARLRETSDGLRLASDRLNKARRLRHDLSLEFRRLVEELEGRADSPELGRRVREARSSSLYRAGGDTKSLARRGGRACRRAGTSSCPRNLRKTAGDPGALRHVAQGEWLCLEDDSLPVLFLVVSGELQAFCWGQRLDEVGEGELAGLTGALTRESPRHCIGFRAGRGSEVATVPAEATLAFLGERRKLVASTVKSLQRRLERAYIVRAELETAFQDEVAGLRKGAVGAIEGVAKRLAPWSDELTWVLTRLGSQLAWLKSSLNGSEGLLRAVQSEEQLARRGMSLSEVRARHEFASADFGFRRLFKRLKSSGTGPVAAGELEEVTDRVHAMAALRSHLHTERVRPDDLTAHSLGVAVWTCRIADLFRLDGETRRELTIAALLHDVGLVEAERRGESFEMKRHPTGYAASSLGRISGLPAGVFQHICQHHEFLDGSGYPRGLVGERLGLGGRILSAANQMDLLIAKGSSPQEALAGLAASPERFDPDVLSGLAQIVKEPAGSGVSI